MSNQFWDLVCSFFEAARSFRVVYLGYESKVLAYADERGVDRRFLRLAGEEVATLIDFKRLQRLCTDEALTLKTIAHNIFRSSTSTDPFDRYVSQAFHELSILKEEQYKVGTIAPGYQDSHDDASYQSIIDEAHEAFPRQIHMIHDLLRRARERLEELMPHYRRDRVTLRSIYLYGDEVFEDFYPNGYEDALEICFAGEGGVRRGLLEASRSFYGAGFLGNAIECLERAQKLPAPTGTAEDVALISQVEIECEELLAELKEASTSRKHKGKARAGSED